MLTFIALSTGDYGNEEDQRQRASSINRPGHTADRVTLLDLRALLDTDLDNNTRHRSTDGAGVICGLLTRYSLHSRVLVFDRDSANLSRLQSIQSSSCVVSKSDTHFSVHLKPHIALSTTLDDRTDGHQADNEGLTLLDGDVHLLSDIWASQEVPGGDDTILRQIEYESQ